MLTDADCAKFNFLILRRYLVQKMVQYFIFKLKPKMYHLQMNWVSSGVFLHSNFKIPLTIGKLVPRIFFSRYPQYFHHLSSIMKWDFAVAEWCTIWPIVTFIAIIEYVESTFAIIDTYFVLKKIVIATKQLWRFTLIDSLLGFLATFHLRLTDLHFGSYSCFEGKLASLFQKYLLGHLDLILNQNLLALFTRQEYFSFRKH